MNARRCQTNGPHTTLDEGVAAAFANELGLSNAGFPMRPPGHESVSAIPALAGATILTALVSVAPREMPRLDEIRLDVVVLSWTTLFSCACAFLFGIVPAIKASGVSGQELVVRSGRGSTRVTAERQQHRPKANTIVPRTRPV